MVYLVSSTHRCNTSYSEVLDECEDKEGERVAARKVARPPDDHRFCIVQRDGRFGRQSHVGSAVRTRPLLQGCPWLLEPGGSDNVAVCRLSILHRPLRSPQAATCRLPSVRRSRWRVPAATVSGRSPVNSGVLPRRSHASYGAMRRRVAAIWSTVRIQRNGMRTVQREGPRRSSW